MIAVDEWSISSLQPVICHCLFPQGPAHASNSRYDPPVIIFPHRDSLVPERADGAIIVIGTKATAVEHYAAKELQRYLYQLSATLPKITSDTDNRRWPAFVLGQAETNPAIQRLVDTGQLTVSAKNPGQQGYVLKKFDADGREVLVIAGSDAIGCLYGVYGLLEDYYGLGFYLGGDILPVRSALRIPSVDQRKRPAVAIRGFLPWTNFPQSATVYSARLAVHHRSNGQDADELSAHSQLQ